MLRHNRIVRFVFVGVANAAISFGILNICFYYLHQSKIVSSIIATTCALLFSFILNRTFVFADKSQRIHRQFVPFAIVTVSGSLVVINLVYIAMLHIMDGHEAGMLRIIKDISGIRLSQSFLEINLSTVVGAMVAMVWNYNGYRLFVFKGKQTSGNSSNEATTNAEETS